MGVHVKAIEECREAGVMELIKRSEFGRWSEVNGYIQDIFR